MAFITKWFKIVKDEKLLGAVTEQSFARYSPTSKRVHICKVIEGQYLFLNDRYYHDDWMLPVDLECNLPYEEAKIVSISEKEYNIIIRAEDIEQIDTEALNNSEPEIIKKEPEVTEVATVEYVRERKLKELSAVCSKTIEDGFDLVLSDEVSHHFSMSFEDQINLINLELALDRHEDVIYHADGELAQYYGEEDAHSIVSGAHMWSQYNRALFNSFKSWINDLNDIETIDSITYDTEIPDEYCSVVLQTLTDNF